MSKDAVELPQPVRRNEVNSWTDTGASIGRNTHKVFSLDLDDCGGQLGSFLATLRLSCCDLQVVGYNRAGHNSTTLCTDT